MKMDTQGTENDRLAVFTLCNGTCESSEIGTWSFEDTWAVFTRQLRQESVFNNQ